MDQVLQLNFPKQQFCIVLLSVSQEVCLSLCFQLLRVNEGTEMRVAHPWKRDHGCMLWSCLDPMILVVLIWFVFLMEEMPVFFKEVAALKKCLPWGLGSETGLEGSLLQSGLSLWVSSQPAWVVLLAPLLQLPWLPWHCWTLPTPG